MREREHRCQTLSEDRPPEFHIHQARWRPIPRPVLITGGAGFIGTNLAIRLLGSGQRIILFDNLSRPRVVQNLQWLERRYGSLVSVVAADVRDPRLLAQAVKKSSAIFHFAAQVAVTTSLINPLEDFEVNARGTLNLLEAMRALQKPPPLLFTSTNKVYGHLEWLALEERESRYSPADPEVGRSGISEDVPLDFESPYGCSKGTAEQYVIDYANSFNLPTAVFRMSCIYGTFQYGNEDQGWVSYFLSKLLNGASITIYGDGKQVRDLLFIDDLIDAMLLAYEHIDQISGRAFNVGGGPAQSMSLLELIDLLARIVGVTPSVQFGPWRTSDQRYYVSNTRRLGEITGWRPKISPQEGVGQLYRWLLQANTKSVSQLSA
jgi:CDP-paratose 2-epimerase